MERHKGPKSRSYNKSQNKNNSDDLKATPEDTSQFLLYKILQKYVEKYIKSDMYSMRARQNIEEIIKEMAREIRDANIKVNVKTFNDMAITSPNAGMFIREVVDKYHIFEEVYAQRHIVEEEVKEEQPEEKEENFIWVMRPSSDEMDEILQLDYFLWDESIDDLLHNLSNEKKEKDLSLKAQFINSIFDDIEEYLSKGKSIKQRLGESIKEKRYLGNAYAVSARHIIKHPNDWEKAFGKEKVVSIANTLILFALNQWAEVYKDELKEIKEGLYSPRKLAPLRTTFLKQEIEMSSDGLKNFAKKYSPILGDELRRRIAETITEIIESMQALIQESNSSNNTESQLINSSLRDAIKYLSLARIKVYRPYALKRMEDAYKNKNEDIAKECLKKLVEYAAPTGDAEFDEKRILPKLWETLAILYTGAYSYDKNTGKDKEELFKEITNQTVEQLLYIPQSKDGFEKTPKPAEEILSKVMIRSKKQNLEFKDTAIYLFKKLSERIIEKRFGTEDKIIATVNGHNEDELNETTKIRIDVILRPLKDFKNAAIKYTNDETIKKELRRIIKKEFLKEVGNKIVKTLKSHKFEDDKQMAYSIKASKYLFDKIVEIVSDIE